MSTAEKDRGLRRELRFWEAIALSVVIMAPTAAMALNGEGVASHVGRIPQRRPARPVDSRSVTGRGVF